MAANSPVQSPADAINVSLRRIGYKLRVASLYDGSKAARSALDIYAQTRDEILRQNDWTFAERNISMTMLKQAPVGGYIPPVTWSTTYPPLPWLFEYAYPTDCLKVRAVKPVPIFATVSKRSSLGLKTPTNNAPIPNVARFPCPW